MSDETEDKELLDAFSQEIEEIKKELIPCVNAIKSNPLASKTQFENFGQIIDRIYGTAATMGHKEFADYCRMMKTVSYKGSQTTNTYAQSKVKELIVVCMAQLEQFQKAIYNPKEIRRIRALLLTEQEKIASLLKTALGDIKRGSVAS